jgi:hypothetical protein
MTLLPPDASNVEIIRPRTANNGDGACSPRRRPSTGPGHDFDRFWEAYPRKDDPGLAAMKFHAERKLVDVEIIIAGAQRYAAERAGEDPQYTMKAHNWLMARAWENGPQPKRSNNRGSSVLDDFGGLEGWARAALNMEKPR